MYTSILLTIAAAASFVAASPATPARRAVEAAQNNCTPGLYYCAGALLGKGMFAASFLDTTKTTPYLYPL